jgi:hypothetical protein
MIPVNPAEPIEPSIFRDYDICITGAALSQYENRPSVKELLRHTWVYARVSPGQKVHIYLFFGEENSSILIYLYQINILALLFSRNSY